MLTNIDGELDEHLSQYTAPHSHLLALFRIDYAMHEAHYQDGCLNNNNHTDVFKLQIFFTEVMIKV